MKKYFLLASVIFFVFSNIISIDAQEHVKALKFIEATSFCLMDKFPEIPSKSNLKPKVLDEVIPIEIVFFSNEDISNFKVSDTLVKMKKTKFDFDKDNFFEPLPKSLQWNNREKDVDKNYIAFFSEYRYNLLMVDIFYVKTCDKFFNYKSLTTMGYCIRFLFEFDKEGDIDKVISTKVFFN